MKRDVKRTRKRRKSKEPSFLVIGAAVSFLGMGLTAMSTHVGGKAVQEKAVPEYVEPGPVVLFKVEEPVEMLAKYRKNHRYTAQERTDTARAVAEVTARGSEDYVTVLERELW